MLVGRENELRQLLSMLDDARSSRSRVLAIVGEAGIGKSSLLDAAAQHATGMTVVRARGVQSETFIPFGGLFELCRPLLPFLDRIPDHQRAALEEALALRPAHRGDRFLVGAATLNLLATAAEVNPVLVLVDDAQWLDGSSADAFRFALRRLQADPVAVVVTARINESSLIGGSAFPLLHLGGLTLDQTRSLIEHHSLHPMPEALVDRLFRGTGGNPLAIVELTGDSGWFDEAAPLDAPVPIDSEVARVYSERLRALPAATGTALLLAASNDSPDLAEFVRAARHLGVGAEDLAPAEAARLITLTGSRLDFCHPLARSATYGAALPTTRREAHRALADALPDVEFDRRAWHLSLSVVGVDDRVSAVLEQAGEHARERSAYDVASRTLDRAALFAPEEERRARLLLAAAESAWLAGMSGRAEGLIEAAKQHATNVALRVAIEELRGYIATRVGRVRAGHQILREAAENASVADPDHAVLMFAEAVNAAFYAGDPAAMRSTSERIVAIAKNTTDRRSRFFSSMAQGMAMIFSGDGREGVALLRSAVEFLLRSEELPNDPRLLAWAAMGPIWLREAGAERSLIATAFGLARAQGAVGILPFLHAHVALDQAATDQWAQAEAGFHEAIDLARETEQTTELAALLSRLAWLEARQGAEDRCREHAAEALQLSRDNGIVLCEIWALAANGDLELGLGNAVAALAALDERARLLEKQGIADPDLSPTPELVEVHLRLGHLEQAAALAEVARLEADRKGQPWATARAERSMGLVAADDAFDIPFASALISHGATPDLFEEARTRLAYGARLRRARRRLEAREQLRLAIEQFDQLGATLWSEAARAELAATGETARRRTPGTINQLTPQELQIAAMLGAGRTTRETAAAVYLSPKTVEYHLRSVYRKLGINSRGDLAAALGGDRSGT